MGRPRRYSDEGIFKGLHEYPRPEEVAAALGLSRRTIYAWRHEPEKFGTPKDLFLKFRGRSLYIHLDVLKNWYLGRDVQKVASGESQS